MEPPSADLKGRSVLLIDDNMSFLRSMEEALAMHGAGVFTTAGQAGARRILSTEAMDVVLAAADLLGSHIDKILGLFRQKNPAGLFYLLSSGTECEIPPSLPVDDCLQRPLTPEYFIHLLAQHFSAPAAESTALAPLDPLVRIIRPYFPFRSPAMRSALENLPRIAASDQTVLISGETGTGKELVSHAIHVLSPRANGPFIAINCGAIPEGLIEGELFGHEKGAFTGAVKTRKGKFEAAHKGTLLLDEIGDMPLILQVRLLRVLEEGFIYRVGGEHPIPVDVRILAATRRDLAHSIEDGMFREDLYYRLNILNIHLPPLRERIEDISFLAVHFLERTFSETGVPPPRPTLSPSTIEMLDHMPWRGNVRELRNLMTRVATLIPSGIGRILPIHILPLLEDKPPLPLPQPASPPSTKEGLLVPRGATLDEAEKLLIADALQLSRGNRTKAARLLGIGLRTLRRKLNSP